MSAAAWGPEPPPDDPDVVLNGGVDDAEGATLLVTTRGGRGQVSAVHLPRRGPALAAQLLPVELPQLSGEDGAEVNLDVVGMSWDPSGRRLAIVLDGSSNGGGDEAYWERKATALELELNALERRVKFVATEVAHARRALAEVRGGKAKA